MHVQGTRRVRLGRVRRRPYTVEIDNVKEAGVRDVHSI